jgi:hypothetical protein
MSGSLNADPRYRYDPGAGTSGPGIAFKGHRMDVMKSSSAAEHISDLFMRYQSRAVFSRLQVAETEHESPSFTWQDLSLVDAE